MIYAAVGIARGKIFEMFSIFSSFLFENAGPRQIGEPADSLSLPSPKERRCLEVFSVLAIFSHALSFFIISFCLVTPRRVSLCLIMFPFIYHVPSCYLYNITLPTVARDPLTVELTMLRLLDHDARLPPERKILK